MRGTSPLRSPQFFAAEQLPEEPPRAEFAVEVEELELGAPRLRRASGLLLLRSGVQESASTKLPAVADLGSPIRVSPEEASPSLSFVTGDVLLRGP